MKSGTIVLTHGSIKGNYLHLSHVIDIFPSSAIGGPNESQRATQLLEVHTGIGQPVLTDIAGDKQIFRKRGWVRDFFKTNNLKAGDCVIIEQTGEYRYLIYPQKR